MKCPRCQHENETGTKFCEECAAPLARICAKCGRPLSATARFLLAVFRAERAGRSGIQLDSDDGQRTLRLAPALRSGGGFLEQAVQDARCRTSELTAGHAAG